MSSNDKTRNKLMESIRKTKAAVSKDTGAAGVEEKAKPSKAAEPKKAASAKTNLQTNTDPYQSHCPRRRVWPD